MEVQNETSSQSITPKDVATLFDSSSSSSLSKLFKVGKVARGRLDRFLLALCESLGWRSQGGEPRSPPSQEHTRGSLLHHMFLRHGSLYAAPLLSIRQQSTEAGSWCGSCKSVSFAVRRNTRSADVAALYRQLAVFWTTPSFEFWANSIAEESYANTCRWLVVADADIVALLLNHHTTVQIINNAILTWRTNLIPR